MATVKLEGYELSFYIGKQFKKAFFKDFEQSLGRNLTEEEKNGFTIDLGLTSFDYTTRDLKGRLEPMEDWVAMTEANIQYKGSSEEIIHNFRKWLEDNEFEEEEIEAYLEIGE